MHHVNKQNQNFNNIFSIGHLYRAGQSMNSLPPQILERYAQCQDDTANPNRQT